jgi:hypothetical protein
VREAFALTTWLITAASRASQMNTAFPLFDASTPADLLNVWLNKISLRSDLIRFN